MLDGESCAFCENRPAEQGKDYCRKCDDALQFDRLAEEALAMEIDGLITEEDDLHGSNTGC